MKIKILGPLEAREVNVSIVHRGKPRQVLALLALYPGQVVPASALHGGALGHRPSPQRPHHPPDLHPATAPTARQGPAPRRTRRSKDVLPPATAATSCTSRPRHGFPPVRQPPPSAPGPGRRRGRCRLPPPARGPRPVAGPGLVDVRVGPPAWRSPAWRRAASSPGNAASTRTCAWAATTSSSANSPACARAPPAREPPRPDMVALYRSGRQARPGRLPPPAHHPRRRVRPRALDPPAPPPAGRP